MTEFDAKQFQSWIIDRKSVLGDLATHQLSQLNILESAHARRDIQKSVLVDQISTAMQAHCSYWTALNWLECAHRYTRASLPNAQRKLASMSTQLTSLESTLADMPTMESLDSDRRLSEAFIEGEERRIYECRLGAIALSSNRIFLVRAQEQMGLDESLSAIREAGALKKLFRPALNQKKALVARLDSLWRNDSEFHMQDHLPETLGEVVEMFERRDQAGRSITQLIKEERQSLDETKATMTERKRLESLYERVNEKAMWSTLMTELTRAMAVDEQFRSGFLTLLGLKDLSELFRETYQGLSELEQEIGLVRVRNDEIDEGLKVFGEIESLTSRWLTGKGSMYLLTESVDEQLAMRLCHAGIPLGHYPFLLLPFDVADAFDEPENGGLREALEELTSEFINQLEITSSGFRSSHRQAKKRSDNPSQDDSGNLAMLAALSMHSGSSGSSGSFGASSGGGMSDCSGSGGFSGGGSDSGCM